MYIRLDVDLKNKLKMTFSWIEWPTSNKQFFINVGQNFTILKWGLECPSLDKKILLNVWYCSIIVRVQSLWNLSHNSKI